MYNKCFDLDTDEDDAYVSSNTGIKRDLVIETDIPIESTEEAETNETEDYAEAGRILLGEEE